MKFNLQYFAENEEVDTTASEVETETEQQTLTQEEVNRLIAQSKSKAKTQAEKEYQKQMDELERENLVKKTRKTLVENSKLKNTVL